MGSVATAQVLAFIPDPVAKATDTSAAEGVGVDSKGNIYGAEVGPKDVKKTLRNSQRIAACADCCFLDRGDWLQME